MMCATGLRQRLLSVLLASMASLATLPTAAMAQPASETLDSSASVTGTFVLPQRSPWAGEVFDLGIRWDIEWQRFNFLDGGPQWSPASLVAGAWSAPVTTAPAPGESAGRVSAATRVMALIPGTLEIEPVTQRFNLRETAGAGGGPRISRVEALASADALVTVRPLPEPPSGFSGAVGQFELTATVSTRELAVGETLAWVLTLRGRGNWPQRPALPARRVPGVFALDDAPALRQIPGASVFEGRLEETLLLVPKTSGTHRLPAVTAVVFDPDAGRHVTLVTPELTVEVTPGSAIERPRPSWASGASEAGAVRAWTPRTGAAAVSVPMNDGLWRMLLAMPVLALLLCWLGLALMHAWRRDPWRGARRAHRRLQRLLPTFTSATPAPADAVRTRLRSWQTLTAQRWNIEAAAPTPDAMSHLPEWASLWREADAVLYGDSMTLPSGWVSRATAVLRQTPFPPRFDFRQALSAEHFLPRARAGALILCCALLVCPAPGSAADDSVPGGPVLAALVPAGFVPGGDWHAAYNHALFLLEEARPNEAAAYAAAAWLRSPGDADALELWRHSARAAGIGEGGVALPRHGVTAALLGPSPGLWRWIAVVSLLVVVLAGLGLLARRYGYGRRRPRGVWVALALLAGLPGGMAWWALSLHGLAASPTAVIVWRDTIVRPIPIEQVADAEAPLIAGGVLAQADRAVLGWHRLILADGDVGWVRREHLVWLWRDNPRAYPDYGVDHEFAADELDGFDATQRHR